jgi:hypothetical protein
MSGGYMYGEPEPKEPCPYCGESCCADFCDVGVGMTQVGPYHCEKCGASEAGPHENANGRPDYDSATGWYLPGSPAGESANVDDSGRHISWQEADSLYRAKHGIPPRY